MLFDKSIILMKEENSYGVDPTPDAANDAFITSVPVVKPLGDHRVRNVARKSFGMVGGYNVGQGIQIEFSMELRGTTGSNDEPPKIFLPLRACGMTQTINSLVSAILNPNSNHDNTSVAIIVNFDGTQHKILGCRGQGPTFRFINNDVVMVDFIFQGIYAGDHASAVAFPTGTFDTTSKRLIFNSANFVLNSIDSLVIENLTLNIGSVLYRRPGSNAASGTHSYCQVSRAPELQVEPEAVALATLDPFTLFDQSTEFDVEWTVQDPDNTAGQVYTFDLYNCQLEVPAEYGQRESIRTWPLVLKPKASLTPGDDDFQISCSLPNES